VLPLVFEHIHTGIRAAASALEAAFEASAQVARDVLPREERARLEADLSFAAWASPTYAPRKRCRNSSFRESGHKPPSD
jgi:hypothetical protein